MPGTFWFPSSTPDRILIHFGFVNVYWYSACMALAILVAFFVTRSLYLKTHKKDTDLVDLLFYGVIAGLIGARLWHVIVYQWGYYSQHVSEIIKIWYGGIAIHGAMVGGVLAIYFFSRRKKISPWYFTDIIAPGFALAQAIGRIGNFFNQELYGQPSNVPWAIFIDEDNRVPGFENFSRFHPTFVYEAVLNLILFAFLWQWARKKELSTGTLTCAYLLGYGCIRFLVDFVRIDPMPMIGPLRLSQIISLALIAIAGFGWYMIASQNKRIAKN